MAKERIDLLVTNAAELVTLKTSRCRPGEARGIDLGIIQNGAVGVREKRIIAVGRTRKIEACFKADETIDASGKVVMPGFVDSHTHLVFAGGREKEFEMRIQGASYLEILVEGGGILQTVKATREASKKELIEAGKKTLDIMLKNGATTVEAKSGYGLTVRDEIKCLEAVKELNLNHVVDVVPTFLGAHAIPPEFRNNSDDYVDLIVEEMIPRVSTQNLAEFCDVFCERGAFSVEQSRRILERGKVCRLKPKIHADEFTKMGGAELAAELNAISAEHLLFASEEGLRAMARKGVIAVLLPSASFSQMTGRYANARRIIQLGVQVALGTDFNPSCWTESVQLAIAFACHEMRLTVGEAIKAATIGAAYSVNRMDEIGSLEEGKKADMIILDIPNYRFLGYRFGVNLVDKVVKEGDIVMERREE